MQRLSFDRIYPGVRIWQVQLGELLMNQVTALQTREQDNDAAYMTGPTELRLSSCECDANSTSAHRVASYLAFDILWPRPMVANSKLTSTFLGLRPFPRCRLRLPARRYLPTPVAVLQCSHRATRSASFRSYMYNAIGINPSEPSLIPAARFASAGRPSAPAHTRSYAAMFAALLPPISDRQCPFPCSL